jgi:hypothetical protein
MELHASKIDSDRSGMIRAREIVEEYGFDSLDYFTLRWGKELFFYKNCIFLAYKLLNGIGPGIGGPGGSV